MANANTPAIQKLYVAYFGRPADASGLSYWESVVGTAANADTSAVSKAFAASAEYKATYAGLSNDAVINAVYQNLFGHAPDVPGLLYWSNLLTKGAITIDNVVTQVAGGALTTDLTAINNKVTAATVFTAALDTTAEILGYSGTTALAAAKTWLAGVTDNTSLAGATATTALNSTVSSVTTPVTVAATTYTLSVSSPSVVEGNATDAVAKQLTYVLTLDSAPTSAVTVNYATGSTGTATAGTDFNAAAGQVVFAAGQTSATVSVAVIGDSTVESDETVAVTFSVRA